jgi:hypothetical protein
MKSQVARSVSDGVPRVNRLPATVRQHELRHGATSLHFSPRGPVAQAGVRSASFHEPAIVTRGWQQPAAEIFEYLLEECLIRIYAR